jgi:hypothetical protein
MPDDYRHKTPYGKWNVKLQKSGTWAASFRVTAGHPAFGVRILDRAVREWGDLSHPSLPSVHSVTAEDRRVNWILPPGEDWAPLSAGPPTLPALEVRRIVFEVGELLSVLHAAGAAAGDLSPELVFLDGEGGRLTLLPTLGLADLTGIDPDPVSRERYVAPEYGGKTPARFDPARADVYSLGGLARRLLRGPGRPARGGRSLPEIDPTTGDWDLFFAGCIARNPARRYSTVRHSFAALGWEGEGGPAGLTASCPLCGAGPRDYPAERAGEFVYCHACSQEFRLAPAGGPAPPAMTAAAAKYFAPPVAPAPTARDRQSVTAHPDPAVGRRLPGLMTPLDLDLDAPAVPVGVPEIFAGVGAVLALAGAVAFNAAAGKLPAAGLAGAGLLLAGLGLFGLETRRWLGQMAVTLCAVVLAAVLAMTPPGGPRSNSANAPQYAQPPGTWEGSGVRVEITAAPKDAKEARVKFRVVNKGGDPLDASGPRGPAGPRLMTSSGNPLTTRDDLKFAGPPAPGGGGKAGPEKWVIPPGQSLDGEIASDPPPADGSLLVLDLKGVFANFRPYVIVAMPGTDPKPLR